MEPALSAGWTASAAATALLPRVTALPPAVLRALFARYGRPLEVAPPPPGADEPCAVVPETGRVRVLGLRTPVDVIANDWLVLEPTDGEALAMDAPHFAAVLDALERAT